ncbi:ubiquinol-cytochrome-c reductase complex assembly factor 2-like [Amphiura filiformis]|uniref:ubiquinol-cytochrome-c reductase complex assembly factor 2-like n=1 Tax=Amphiura filiformis TaxID=82378 RepID=UPI003B21383F
MAATRYRKFLQLIEQWPLDSSKKGRDLGMHIREMVAIGFKQGPATQINERKCDEMYEALQKMNTDYYRNKYPRLYQSSATGATLEECKIVTSKDSKEIKNLK